MPSQKVASAYVDLQLQTAAFKAAINEAGGEMRKFGAQMREETQKSRESVRLLSEELGLGIPRGLQGIISKLPGVTTAMNLAFDGVVVFALIKTVVEVTEKVVEFGKKNEEAAAKNAATWKEVGQSVGGVNRDLTLSNARIQDSIAKLEHKPGDGLKTALLEAADAAQMLSEKLDEDIEKLLKVTSERKIGVLDELTGHGQDNLDRTIGYGARQYRKIVPEYDTVLQSAASRGDWNNYRQVRQEEISALHAALDPQLSTLGDYLREHQDLAISNPNEPSFAKAKSGYDTLSGLLTAIEGQAQQENGQHTQKGLESGNDAAALRLKSMEDAFAREKAMWGMSIEGEIAFWTDKLSAFSKGSEQYRTIQEKLYAEYGERSKQFDAIRKSTAIANVPDDVVTASDAIGKWLESQADDVLHTGETWKAFNSELAKGYEQYEKFTEKLANTKLSIAESTGAISPHAAALQQAAIHAEAYAKALATLREQLKQINSDASLTPAQRAAASSAVSNQISQLGYDNDITKLTDQNKVYLTSFSGEMNTMFDDWIKQATDLRSIVGSLFTESISQINSAIIRLFTTRNDPHPFRGAGHAIFTDVASAGLKGTEGELLKSLGIGGKKQHVIVDNWPGGVGGGSVTHAATSGLLGILNDSNWASSLFGGQLFGAGGVFGGARAGGGLMNPGDWYLTGEQGPELLQVGSTSKINNARDTAAMFSPGTGDTHIHLGGIDARGATDPAAINAAVQRGLRQAAPHIAAAGNTAQRDQRSRRPASRP